MNIISFSFKGIQQQIYSNFFRNNCCEGCMLVEGLVFDCNIFFVPTSAYICSESIVYERSVIL